MNWQNIYISTIAVAVLSAFSCQKTPVPDTRHELNPVIEMKVVTDESVMARIHTKGVTLDYYSSVISVEEYERIGGDEALLAMGEQYIPELRRNLMCGDQIVSIEGLDAETDYYLYVFSLSKEGKAGKTVTKEPFRTEIKTYPEFKAEISVDAVRSVFLTVSVFLENVEEMFCITALSQAEFEAGTKDLAFMQDYFDKMLESNIDLDNGIDKKTLLNAYLIKGGEGKGNIMYLTPYTDYTIAALRVTDDGTVTGFVTENAKTTFNTPADGEITFNFDKYYDAAYLGYPGMAAIPVSLTVSGSPTGFIFAAYRGDFSSTSNYPDYIVHSMLLNNSSALENTNSIVYILPWDTQITLLGYTYSMGGSLDFGNVARKELKMTMDGASDIKDYLLPDDTKEALSEYNVRANMPLFVQK